MTSGTSDPGNDGLPGVAGRPVRGRATTEEPRRETPAWMVAGFVAMAVYLAALGGGTVYGFIKDAEDDERIDQLVETNRRNAEIAAAQGCVNSHERTVQFRDAVGITPDALVEVSGDADPAEVEAFLDAIQRRVDDTIESPDCDLPEAEADLERLGVEP